MTTALKAEFRKLLTVRSTYVITGFVILLVFFVTFYGFGFHLGAADRANPLQLSNDILDTLVVTVFGAIVAILLVTHEYRYNTIMYTLTTSNNRNKVLFAKFITVSVYAVVLAAIVGVLSPLSLLLGVHLHGQSLVPQTLHYTNLIWRGLFYSWGISMMGWLLAVITRNQVASIVTLFVFPDLIEQLLSIWLKKNTVYLPFSALKQVVVGGDMNGPPGQGMLTPGRAVEVFCLYLIVGGIVAWWLFNHRDAN